MTDGDRLDRAQRTAAALADHITPALPEAEALALECVGAADWLPAAVTLTALAWGLREIAQYDRALDAADRALRAAGEAGSDHQRARARLVRAKTRLDLGQLDAARDDARAAAETGLDDPDLRLTAALIAWHTGDVAEAGRILQHLVDDPACPAEIRMKALLNLADEIAVGRPHDALALLDEAGVLAGSGQHAAYVDHNRGLALARAGRIAQALTSLERAEQAFLTGDGPLAEHYHEVADVLAELRLIPEARAAAEKSVRRLTAEGNGLILADALLTAGRLALADDDEEGARAALTDAAALYADQGRRAGAARAAAQLARLVRLPSAADVREVADGADALAGLGHAIDGARTWLQAAEMAARGGDHAAARRYRQRVAELDLPNSDLVLEARARLALDDGRPEDAAPAIAAAIALVDGRAALAGSGDLRHRITCSRVRFEQLNRDAVRRLPPPGYVDALLRTRPPALAPACAGPCEEDRLAWRQLVARLVGEDESPETLAAVREQVDAVERRLRIGAWADGLAAPELAPEGLAPTLAAVGDLAVIAREGRCAVAFRAGPGGVSRFDLGDWDHLLDRFTTVQRGLARVATSGGAMRERARAATLTMLADLDAGLGPVFADAARLTVLLDRGLESAPLVALPTLWPVALTTASLAVTRRQDNPAAGPIEPGSQAPGSQGNVVVAAGPGLTQAEPEVAQVRRAWRAAPVVTTTTAEATRAALPTARVVHLAAHATLRWDNPMQSPIRFADGPLALAELVEAAARPRLLYLSCCSLGAAPRDPALVSAVALLAEHGVGEVVASTVPLSDVDAPAIAATVHATVAAGEAVADGLARARRAVDPRDPGDAGRWCALAGLVLTRALP